MRCETARRMMMDRLYETLPTEKGKMLNAHLNTCAACAAEWDDVQSAHSFMKYLPEKNVPIFLQQAVLEQSQSEALPPLSESASHHVWRWAAAAAFIMTIGISYSIWNTTPPKHQNDAALASPGLNELAHKKLDGSIKKTEELLHLSTPSIQEKKGVEKIVQFSSTESHTPSPPPSMETVALVTRKSATPDAEVLFRTGLHIYNMAFMKLGKERETLLRSALLLLKDLEDLPSGAKQWVAMGMILKADSYRALNEPDKAIKTYQQMAERFTGLPVYCQEARASTIKLMLERDSQVDRIEEQLVKYEAMAPPPVEFASMALAYSEKIFSSSPGAAILWSKRAADSLPERHPVHEKALRKYQELEIRVRDRYYVQDWKVIGPFPQDTILDENKIGGHTDVMLTLMKTIGREKNYKQAQRKPNGEAVIDVADLLHQAPVNSCAFAQTSIYSPVKQNIQFLIGFSGRIRVTFNGDPIFGSVENPNFERDSYRVFCQLKKGWNTLLVKSFHERDVPEWKFSILVADKNGNVLPDLKYDSSHSVGAK